MGCLKNFFSKGNGTMGTVAAWADCSIRHDGRKSRKLYAIPPIKRTKFKSFTYTGCWGGGVKRVPPCVVFMHVCLNTKIILYSCLNILFRDNNSTRWNLCDKFVSNIRTLPFNYDLNKFKILTCKFWALGCHVKKNINLTLVMMGGK